MKSVASAWSAAALIGPTLVDRISEAKKKAGVPPEETYNFTLYLMASLLVVGLIANLLVRPVDPRHQIDPS